VNTPSATAKKRDRDSPSVIAKDGWRFHHIGIPTDVARPGETHLPWLKVHVSGYDYSPYGIHRTASNGCASMKMPLTLM